MNTRADEGLIMTGCWPDIVLAHTEANDDFSVEPLAHRKEK
jgi:hypothetical protein